MLVMRSAWAIPVYRTRHWLAVLVLFALPDRYARMETVLPLVRLVQMEILRAMAVDPAVMVVPPVVAPVTVVLMEATEEATVEAMEDLATAGLAVVPMEVTTEVPMGEATVALQATAPAMEAQATVEVAMEAQVVDLMEDRQAATVVLQVVVLETDQTAATRKETVAALVRILAATALLLATVAEIVVRL